MSLFSTYKGRRRAGDSMPHDALAYLAFAEFALKRNDQDAYLRYRAATRDALHEYGYTTTAIEQMMITHHHLAQDIAEGWRTDWQHALDMLGEVKVCTGEHGPGPRRMAGPDADLCVWCEAPILLGQPYGTEGS